ncbi:hypothetical protein [Streptomyces sp. AC550_RSS872]|uniref:hypothetical protein n=1 Tax=Streptomyces sp. AC550_RSS872 TaxID=2823689 RepID=UPI001C26A34E|nr:hypothetical protein [Streptomyces sp. AC550_RSS872]
MPRDPGGHSEKLADEEQAVGPRVGLGDGGDTAFSSGLLARTLHPARVAADQIVGIGAPEGLTLLC